MPIANAPSLGVYVHLPFCPYICPYCDFAKWRWRTGASERYMQALVAEIEAQPTEDAATIFLGGGTPNAYDAHAIVALLGRLRDRFDGRETVRERSIELNPELVRPGDMEAYREAGIGRISLGVQSFEPSEIATLGRKHTPEQIRDVVAAARAAAMPSVSLDLMFAVPGQSRQSWQRNVRSAIELGADHISTYGLTVEEGTPYEKWQRRDPRAFFDDAREAELYDEAICLLESAGYEHYEISNFAKPGHGSQHNANYWRNGEYIGLGVGAASYRGGERSVHTRAFDAYVEAARAGASIPSERERLPPGKALGEAIMLALRTAQGVSLEGFKDRYGVDVMSHYAPVVEEYSQAGLLLVEDDRMYLTRRGKFLANDVCGAFVTFE